MTSNRFKNILIVGAILTLIVAVGWTYSTTVGEINFLSWDFALVSLYFFLRLFSLILITGIIFGGGFLLIQIFIDSDFIDDWLLFKVREHQTAWLWTVFILFLIFCTTIGILLLRPWLGIAEWEEMFKYAMTLIFSGESFMIGLLIALKAKISEPPKLSSALADAIPPKLIVRYPESAVKEAFTFFEHRLRQKLYPDDDTKRSAIDLINKAFGKNGRLKNAQGDENRNLMVGIIGKYRNPLSHKPVNLDKQTVTMILILIDQFVQVVDESELQSSQQTSNGSNEV
ncbi:MAG TPA: hypothetical protein DCM38_12610 [Gammaproteobacteria bacterium]|nr:hypothetical protein [Gammaproteobacteria bacterium]